MTEFILDVSNHQGRQFDVSAAVLRYGFTAVIAKATEGTTFKDPLFGQHISGAREGGAIPGAYHFLRQGNGAQQAQIFHARVREHGGPHGWLCACDCEADADYEDVAAFCAEWASLSGGHPLLMYSGAWWWGPRGWDGQNLTPYLWHSHYVQGSAGHQFLYGKVPDEWWTPGYGNWSEATLLQFTDKAWVWGQSVDVSVFRGTREELLALTHQIGEDMQQSDIMTSSRTGPASVGHVMLATYDGVEQDIKPALARLEERISAMAVPAVTLTDQQVRMLGEQVLAGTEGVIRRVLAALDESA